ncbi:MAG TPA: MarR family transcriptional regulator [Candidatus Dormibacteraeota bacterium]|jgi:DNA-binding MarR family transcriptional regulator
MAHSNRAMGGRSNGGYPEALGARVGFLLARAHLIAREKADRALAGVGLTMKGYAALATLMSDGPVSQQRLSQRIRMDPATMVDVIDTLELSGHIQRRRNPEDRREYGLHTTPKGRALFARAQKVIEIAEAEALQGLAPDEAKVLIELLARIADPRSGSPMTDELITGAMGR